MVKGHIIGKEKLNEFVEQAFDRSNLVATALRYAEYIFIEK
jgi:hypothetical protein